MADRNVERELDELHSGLGELRDNLGQWVDRAGDAGNRALRQARDRAGHVVDDARGRARAGVSAAQSEIEERPFTSVGVAFFAGAVVGALVADLFHRR